MTLPDPVRQGVEGALQGPGGRGASVVEVTPVGGGCISPTGRIRTDDGGTFFLKWGDADLPRGLLPAEARGLALLREAGAIRVPGVVGVGGSGDGETGEDRPEWLLLEWLEPGSATPDAWERLGRELAALHRTRGEAYGADAPNFIGALPQENTPADDWAAFWRDRRLAPQAERARAAGLLDDGDLRSLDTLYDRLPEILAAAAEDGPSRLHGDLWNGNVHMLAGGEPAVIDPSVYHGHREVDLAMAELFGGFGPGFRAAYEEAWPLAPGYGPRRRAAYQLYYLLVHVNLFGRSYVARTRGALDTALG